MFWSLRRSARFAQLTVSKPTNRLRSPASTARSSRSGWSADFTVPAAGQSRPIPAIPSKSASAKRRLPSE
ncbi:hypothetical protein [Streptomyces sp. NPDC005148]